MGGVTGVVYVKGGRVRAVCELCKYESPAVPTSRRARALLRWHFQSRRHRAAWRAALREGSVARA